MLKGNLVFLKLYWCGVSFYRERIYSAKADGRRTWN